MAFEAEVAGRRQEKPIVSDYVGGPWAGVEVPEGQSSPEELPPGTAEERLRGLSAEDSDRQWYLQPLHVADGVQVFVVDSCALDVYLQNLPILNRWFGVVGFRLRSDLELERRAVARTTALALQPEVERANKRLHAVQAHLDALPELHETPGAKPWADPVAARRIGRSECRRVLEEVLAHRGDATAGLAYVAGLTWTREPDWCEVDRCVRVWLGEVERLETLSRSTD